LRQYREAPGRALTAQPGRSWQRSRAAGDQAHQAGRPARLGVSLAHLVSEPARPDTLGGQAALAAALAGIGAGSSPQLARKMGAELHLARRLAELRPVTFRRPPGRVTFGDRET